MSNKAAIIGYSGHAFVVLDILLNNQFTLVGYCETEAKGYNPYQINYLGCEDDESTLSLLKDINCFIGIGSNIIRYRIFNLLSEHHIKLPTVAHKQSFISSTAKLKQAIVVMPGAVINSLAKIGNAVICNSTSVIEHECEIADFVHIGPGAVLAGNVKVGSQTFIGANAVIKPGISIGSNVIIGAGSVVIKDVADNAVVYGNPAKSK